MEKIILFLIFGIFLICSGYCQHTEITGKLVDVSTFESLVGVTVKLETGFFETQSKEDGTFLLNEQNLPEGEQILVFSKTGYVSKRLPILIITGQSKDLEVISLQYSLSQEQKTMATLSISDTELNEEETASDNLSGLLQASRDVFLNAAAFDFSPTFFRPRGLGSEYSKVLINGLEMNKIFTGRPQWSDWGGLNDVQRTQEFSMATGVSNENFGGLAGTTNITMRASAYSRGAKVSYAASNRSYTGRIMASYSSGERPNGWYYSLSASRRFAQQGYVDGTIYNAYSFFVSVEKKLDAQHSLNFTAFYTPNIRGKSSANTQEVYNLKDRKYNAYWGYQNGEIRNSRLREIKEPVFMLNHFWQLSEKTKLNSNLSYQFGKVANTHIDFGGTNLSLLNGQQSFSGGGSNPDPTYYQKLPSYFLRFLEDANYESAYLAQTQFSENGQINWLTLYEANLQQKQQGKNAIYALAEDRNDDTMLYANSILESTLNEHSRLNASLSYRYLKSHNFAQIRDLLGGNSFLDIDFFAEATAEQNLGEAAQNDLQHENRLVAEGDIYKYNYNLNAEIAEAFAQYQLKYDKIEAFFSTKLSNTSYQREGLFKNGIFPDNSLGKSEALNFNNFGLKAGATYQANARQFLSLNAYYATLAPNLRNVYSNARQNNESVKNLQSEKLQSLDISYRHRASWLNLRATAYYTASQDGTELSFYYADGLSGLGRTSTTAFVQEVLTKVNKLYFGAELGAESQLTPTLKLKLAASFGQFTYNNNPNVYLTSNNFERIVNYGTSYLKNYKLAGGPQQAAQVGLEYNDPDFWWFGASLNFFSNAYADIAPLTRTSNFLTDADGQPLLDYDEDIARNLLKQEELENYVLLNAVGGKSWKIKRYYLGFFLSLNNILDKLYKTGGFEQSRNANYRSLKEDKEREQPLFGNKYWYGNGSSYYANVYIRF